MKRTPWPDALRLRRLLALFGVAGAVGVGMPVQAMPMQTPVQAPSAQRARLEARVAEARLQLASEALADGTPATVAQANTWNNWPNFNNWANWANG